MFHVDKATMNSFYRQLYATITEANKNPLTQHAKSVVSCWSGSFKVFLNSGTKWVPSKSFLLNQSRELLN